MSTYNFAKKGSYNNTVTPPLQGFSRQCAMIDQSFIYIASHGNQPQNPSEKTSVNHAHMLWETQFHTKMIYGPNH